MAKKKQTVILYTANGCPWCSQVKAFLNDKKINFEERNVNEKEEYARELNSLGYAAVPLTVVGNDCILGFNVKSLSDLVGIKT